jgi:TIR domain
VQESIDDLVIRARAWRDEHESHDTRRFGIFVYAFGLGNLRDIILGQKVPPVANLLSDNPVEDCVISSDLLLDGWSTYRDRIRSYTSSMLGATPMVLALERAEQVMTRELHTDAFESDALLLVLSDGLPTDGGSKDADNVRASCDRLKQLEITILSCYISDDDVTMHRTLYAQPSKNWSEGARLMFDCASVLPRNSVFWPHLHEHNWTAPPGSRLFAQINQSEVLTEFVETLLGPIEQQAELTTRDQKKSVVFVSYSHADRKYVEEKPGSLLYYLRGLEHEGIQLWWDDRIPPGALWDTVIREKLGEATVALVLVSQAFLTSKYCTNVEIESFIRRRKEGGLTVIPIVLSACEWSCHDWLSETQALPREGKAIESHYTNPGRRKELYLEILRSIRFAV